MEGSLIFKKLDTSKVRASRAHYTLISKSHKNEILWRLSVKTFSSLFFLFLKQGLTFSLRQASSLLPSFCLSHTSAMLTGITYQASLSVLTFSSQQTVLPSQNRLNQAGLGGTHL